MLALSRVLGTMFHFSTSLVLCVGGGVVDYPLLAYALS